MGVGKMGNSNNWIVMSATELTKNNSSRKRSFTSNATNLDEKQAEIEAAYRNEVERKNGNTNTLWYPVEWTMPEELLKALGRK